MSTYIFLGDSITDAGRLWPADEQPPYAPGGTREFNSPAGSLEMARNAVYIPGLGSGYVAMLQQVLDARRSKGFADSPYSRKIQIINKGHDGFTVQSLLQNVRTDCVAYDPDFISILVGINDVGIAMNTGCSLAALHFEENYRRLLDTLQRSTRASLLCIGPFIFSHPQRYQHWEGLTREAEAIIASIASQYDVPFLPMQDRLNAAARAETFRAITIDGIHLTARGHRILTEEILKYLP